MEILESSVFRLTQVCRLWILRTPPISVYWADERAVFAFADDIYFRAINKVRFTLTTLKIKIDVRCRNSIRRHCELSMLGDVLRSEEIFLLVTSFRNQRRKMSLHRPKKISVFQFSLLGVRILFSNFQSESKILLFYRLCRHLSAIRSVVCSAFYLFIR